MTETAPLAALSALPACRIALVELPGGPLWWDVVDQGDTPAGGLTGANADLAGDRELLAGLHRLALLTWADAWWPAGYAVPALDPGLLAADVILTVEAVELYLDDPDALDRALAGLDSAVSALLRLAAAQSGDDAAGSEPAGGDLAGRDLAEHAVKSLERLRTLAQDHGLEAELAAGEAAAAHAAEVGGAAVSGVAGTAPTHTRAGLALAAGGHGPGTPGGAGTVPTGPVLAAGNDAIAWSGLPRGVLPAEARAEWTITLSGGTPELAVTTPALAASAFMRPGPTDVAPTDVAPADPGPKAPASSGVAPADPAPSTQAPAAHLRAALGDLADFPLELPESDPGIGGTGYIAGSAPLPAQALTLPRDELHVRVYDDRYAGPGAAGQPGAATNVAVASDSGNNPPQGPAGATPPGHAPREETEEDRRAVIARALRMLAEPHALSTHEAALRLPGARA